MIQTSIQFAIALSFIFKVFSIAEMPNSQRPVIGLFAAAFLIVMVVCFVLTLTPGFLNCEKSTMGEVWIILIVCGVIQSIMICLCSCYLARTMKSRADLLRKSISA